MPWSAVFDDSQQELLKRLVHLAAEQLLFPAAAMVVLEPQPRLVASSGLDGWDTGRFEAVFAELLTRTQPTLMHDFPRTNTRRHHELNDEDPDQPLDPLEILGLRFFHGVPVRLKTDQHVATLCVLDTVSRSQLGSDQESLMTDLANLSATVLMASSADAGQSVQDLETRGAQVGRSDRQPSRDRALVINDHDNEARETHRKLLESVGGVFWEADTDRPGYTYVSPTIEAILGFPRQAWMRTTLWEERLHPDDRERVLETARNWDQFADQFTHEYRIIAADGRVVWFRDAVTIMRSPGQPAKFRGVFTDITAEKQMVQARERAESRIRRVFADASIGILVVGNNGSILEANTAIQKMLGYAEDELIGMAVDDLTHPHDREPERRLFVREVLQGGKTRYQIEKRYLTKTEQIVWINATVSYVFNADQSLDCCMVMIEDISARHSAEREWLETERQYKALVHSIDGLIWEAYADRPGMSFVGPQVEQMFGYRRSEWLAEPSFWEHHLHPDDLERAVQDYQRSVRNGMNYQSEYRFRTSDGRWVWIRDVVSLVVDEHGQRKLRGVMFDITEDKLRLERLKQLESVAVNASDAVIIGAVEPGSLDVRIVYANEAFARLSGYALNELIGQSPKRLQGPQTDRATLDRIRRALECNECIVVELLNYARNGRPYWVEVDLRPIPAESAGVRQFISVQRDITERRRAEAFERDRLKVLEMIVQGEAVDTVMNEVARALESGVDGAQAWIYAVEADQLVLHAASRYPSSLDRASASFDLNSSMGSAMRVFLTHTEPLVIEDVRQATMIQELIAPAEQFNVLAGWSAPILARDGQPLGFIGLTFSQPRSPRPGELERLTSAAHLVAVLIEQRGLMEQLSRQARFDGLTGLHNRASFEATLERRLESARHSGAGLGVVFLDLDGFKHVNDTLGHRFGDELLCQVAGRFLEDANERVLVARFGGDEFALLLDGVTEQDALERMELLLERLRLPFWVHDLECFVTASAGIACFPEHGADVDDLLRNADVALYQTKGRGKNGVMAFDARMSTLSTERLELNGLLRRALEREEFEVYYQPQVNLSGGLLAFEALIRWNRPGVGLVSPGVFMPVAEETGLIVPMDTWMLDRVCAQMAAWRRDGLALVPCSVNITTPHLLRSDFVASIRDTLQRHQLEPGFLELELTESVLMQNFELAIERITALREMGVRVALDDFGTGYSSLSYLRDLPFDTLKIDRSFVTELQVGMNERNLVPAMVALAKQLRLEVVAEGIESALQVQLLSVMGCDRFQGFLFGRPETVQTATARLRHGEPITV